MARKLDSVDKFLIVFIFLIFILIFSFITFAAYDLLSNNCVKCVTVGPEENERMECNRYRTFGSCQKIRE